MENKVYFLPHHTFSFSSTYTSIQQYTQLVVVIKSIIIIMEIMITVEHSSSGSLVNLLDFFPSIHERIKFLSYFFIFYFSYNTKYEIETCYVKYTKSFIYLLQKLKYEVPIIVCFNHTYNKIINRSAIGKRTFESFCLSLIWY